MLLQLDSLAHNVDHSKEIDDLDNSIFAQYKPNNFDGPKSVEVEYNRQFESTYLIIAQQTSLAPKNLTVLQFYSILDDIKKQFKNNKQYGRRR